MIKPRRIGHATFETPDLEKAIAYYEKFMGLIVAEREKDRAFLASKVGPLAIQLNNCLLYTSPSPRDGLLSRMPSSA